MRMAETPEESDFTSIQKRIAQLGEDSDGKIIIQGPSQSCRWSSSLKTCTVMPTAVPCLTIWSWSTWRAGLYVKGSAVSLRHQSHRFFDHLRFEPSRFLERTQGEALTERLTVLVLVQRIRQVARESGQALSLWN
jgi:hypothetical protein